VFAESQELLKKNTPENALKGLLKALKVRQK
jgi:hypothetical protein